VYIHFCAAAFNARTTPSRLMPHRNHLFPAAVTKDTKSALRFDPLSCRLAAGKHKLILLDDKRTKKGTWTFKKKLYWFSFFL
jgi:hypothetical protein